MAELVVQATSSRTRPTGLRCRTGLLLVVLAAALVATGCAGTTSVGSPSSSCSPSFSPSSSLGTLTAQQKGKGYGIQWGVYPTQPAASFVIDVYMNNQRVDHKSQNYPPHGSVNARDVVSGGVFRLEGTVTNAKGDQAIFYLACRTA
ncbi:hypothetical protein [Frankia sp. Cr2]|uniref:hypothetical protein n=1 Tax=Frankia sp. Cr2 TaxID=3073932 RepID=UPI002AD2A20D|nr:hypothetical protein [Frankia sp. Cr2]